MAKSDIQKLQEKLIKFRDKRDWAQFHNPKDLAISLTLEAAELLEHFQWKTTEEIKEYAKKNKEKIGDEIADVAAYLLTLAHELNIDLAKAIRRKIKKNVKKYPVEKAKGSAKKWNEL